MKDIEFKDFDHEPEISYFVTGEHPFNTDDDWSEDVKVYNFDEAL